MAEAPTNMFGGRLIFNPEAWGQYVNELPPTKTYRFMNSGIVVQDGTIAQFFNGQSGSFSQRIPIYGGLEADEDNYDGNTKMPEAGYQDSYSAATVAYGRQFSVAEKDFSYDLIPGANFAEVLRRHIVKIKDDAFEKRLFGITNALFGTVQAESPTPESEFAKLHTYDITSQSGKAAKIGETTLNDALQQACGEFKSDFTMIAMHSQVATNLENLKLVDYAKGVDANGVIKDLGIATWNGKTVVIDDRMPYDPSNKSYTTYAYGRGCFGYTNVPIKVPFEAVRDHDYGIDKLYVRYREVLAPRGWSFEGKPASLSPTDAELFTPTNWKLADNGKTETERKTYPINRIPLVRIKSLG